MHGDIGWFVSFKIALHIVFLCIGAALAWGALAERFL